MTVGWEHTGHNGGIGTAAVTAGLEHRARRWGQNIGHDGGIGTQAETVGQNPGPDGGPANNGLTR